MMSQVFLCHFSDRRLTLLDRVTAGTGYALPITPCGLKLDDEAVRVAVGIRLALKLCVRHQCRCGTQFDYWPAQSCM